MTERDTRCTLSGKVQVDVAYLGGEGRADKAGRVSENKVGFIAVFSVSDEGHPLRIKLNTVAGFKLNAISEWVSRNLAAGSTVYSEGSACFSAVTKAGCIHESTVVAGRHGKCRI